MTRPRPDVPAARRRSPRRSTLLALFASLGAHLLILWAILGWASGPPPPPENPPIEVAMVELPPPSPPPPPSPIEGDGGAPAGPPAPDPEPEPEKPAPPRPEPPKPARQAVAKPVPARPTPRPPPPEVPTIDPASEVSDAELASAAIAGGLGSGSGSGGAGAGLGGGGGGAGGGGGSGGGQCNMLKRLQDAMRRDPKVRAWVAEAIRERSGRAIRLWNGDWVRSGLQEGKGLAGVRQVILVEVGFAPAACRSQRVNGSVLITLDDAPEAPRVVLGTGSWRWSDVLYPPGGVAGHRRAR